VIFFLPRGIVGTIQHWISLLRNRSSRRHREPEAWPKPSDEATTLLRIEHQDDSAPVLGTKKLTIRFGGLAAVSEVDLAVKRASVHAIIGPNGAGKTTLLNALSGFYKPTEGEVFLHDTDIGGKRSDHVARGGLTRTFQNTELFADMTLEENVLVAFDARYRGGFATAVARLPEHFREERQMRARARMLLDYVGLGDYTDEIAKNLAFGHQRRLEIARALALSPEVLLLDEPAAGLTHSEIDDLIALIRHLKSLGITVVLVEHHVDMIMTVSDTVTVLEYGQVIANGTPQEIQNNPRVVEAYFGGAAVQSDKEATT